MKKNLVLAAFFSLFVMAISASAQTANFSGTWNLDLAKSKLSDREKASIKSQTLTVTQTAADITVATATERNEPPAGAPAGGGRMGGGSPDGSTTYTLDGKEFKSEVTTGMGSMQVSTKAKLDGGKLAITRTTTTPMGERTSSETWSLGADGTLSIESQRPNRDGGTDTSTRVFTKKQ